MGEMKIWNKHLPFLSFLRTAVMSGDNICLRHGLAEAQLELGVIYGKGQGVPVDRIKSIEMYKLAAEQNSATAHFNLGIIYLNGEGIKQDIESGIQHMSQAASLGMDEAKEVLVMLKNDHGLESDETPTLQ